LYSHKKIYDYPGFSGIIAHDLIDNFVREFKLTKIPSLTSTSITSIDLKNSLYEIKTNTNNIILAKYIIIATGAGLFSPNKLEIPGANDKNVSYSVGQKSEYKGKRVVILGGGDSSVD
jgi:thioredoxin reductase (NADPH)